MIDPQAIQVLALVAGGMIALPVLVALFDYFNNQ
jgi:hypothetical protein